MDDVRKYAVAPVVGKVPKSFMPGIVQERGAVDKVFKELCKKFGKENPFNELEMAVMSERLVDGIIKEYLEVVEEELLKGNRVELGDILLLRPYQSRYDLHHSIEDSKENVDRKKNKITNVLRRSFQDELNEKDFHGLTPRGR